VGKVLVMITTIYIGVINGMKTWEVFLDGELIGTNQIVSEEEYGYALI
jgi:hypothetical protein